MEVFPKNSGLDVAVDADCQILGIDRTTTHPVHLIRGRLVSLDPCAAVLATGLVGELPHPAVHLVQRTQ